MDTQQALSGHLLFLLPEHVQSPFRQGADVQLAKW